MTPRDEKHLRALALGYYLFAVGWVLLGLAFVANMVLFLSVGGVPRGSHLSVFGAIALLALLLAFFGLLSFGAGRCLALRKGQRVILLAAGLNVLVLPFGTVLAVMTVLTLKRPEVREAFGRR